jgi:hypothetical protein
VFGGNPVYYRAMQRPRLSTITSLLCAVAVAITPFAAYAEDVLLPPPAEPAALAPVIITEVQTGHAARADEFIELHNTTDEAINLAGWQMRYITASATSTKQVEDPSAIIEIAPPSGSQTAMLPPRGHYLLYAGTVTLPQGASGQLYEGLLPATGGSLVLVSPEEATCQLFVRDALAWGDTTHLYGEGEALLAGASSSADQLFQRYIAATGTYIDTANNAHNFAVESAVAQPVAASPAAVNGRMLPETVPGGTGVPSQPLPGSFANANCAPPDSDPPDDSAPPPTDGSPPSVTEPPAPDPDEPPRPAIPAGNLGLKPPLLSEFLPNPAKPQTDKDDEFIELYNSNNVSFNLSGYKLEVGLKSKRGYTFPAGTKIGPKTFLAFFSADTKLALSNGGSQVSLLDPLERLLASSQAYGSAKDGEAWVLAGGKWQWTTRPTPDALNIISAPPVKGSRKQANKTASATRTAGASVQSGGSGTEDETEVAATTTSTPLHPGVLALIAISALLYGAYEYRQDLANKLYQFRSHRAARRTARQSAEGR